MDTNEKINKLRELMKDKKIDYYIVPTSDPHQSEYVAECYQSRSWISGFTGSAGTVVISQKEALLWTDGRYFIQAENEIKNSEFKLMKMGTPGYPSLSDWISDKISDGENIGFDGRMMSQSLMDTYSEKVKTKDVKFITEYDLIGEIWENRPDKPETEAFLLDVKYAGKTSKDKLIEVRKVMEEKGVDYFIIGSLDDIAWLYNIRGRDVESNPVNISYSLVSKDEAYLCINSNKVNNEVKHNLNENGVTLKEYDEIFDLVKSIEKDSKVILDKRKINSWLYGAIKEDIEIIDETDITTNIKGIKNEIEIKNQRNAYIKDGVAMTKLFYWIDKNIGKKQITEVDAQNKLEEIREELYEDYIEPSFPSISAYGPNAAMMHYRATEKSHAVFQEKGMYLLDCGAQFLDGTTDTTRTIALGPITDEEKKDFTLTLKGHINLIRAKFLEGTTGSSLDILSRAPLWMEGLDYKCGTGHGVGFVLNVHEGPHRIANAPNDVSMKEGMIVTIEPGVYKTNKHGIRIENVVVVKKDIKNGVDQFYSFEVLSFVPIDLRCIDKNLLNFEEKEWLNKYHKETYEKIGPHLNDEEKIWLKEQTKSI